jgi:hypothetical protein
MRNALTNELPLSVAAKAAVAARTGMDERQIANYFALVSMELLKLKTAYPAQARNYSPQEMDALTALWLEIFAEVDLRVLHEAVRRFIAGDRKAFFPAPGQIMGIVEILEKERKYAELERLEYEYLQEKLKSCVEEGFVCQEQTSLTLKN